MRTTLSLKIPKRSVTPLIAVLLLTGTVSLGTACDDDKDYSRREHIEWSNSPEFEEALTGTLHIPVRASKEQEATPFKRSIYIRSNVAYQVGFEGEKEESGELPAEEWLNVDEIKRGVRPGIDELVLLITPHTESYVERKGCISLHTDVEFLNEFIAVVQGFPKYTKDYEGNFDWLKYGSAEPLETRGETPIDSWTADQKKMGLESTPAQEGGTAYCYGKNGYVKIGLPLGPSVYDEQEQDEMRSNLAFVADFDHFDEEAYFGLNNYSGNQNALSLSLMYNHYFTYRSSINVGGQAHLNYYRESLLNPTPWIAGTSAGDFTFDRTEGEAGLFAEYTYSIKDKFSLVAGIRGDYNRYFDNFFATPRGHIRWNITRTTTLRASAGLGYRTTNIITDNVGMLATGRKLVFDNGFSRDFNRMEKALTFGGSLTQSFTLVREDDATLSFDYFRTQFYNSVVVDQEMDPSAIHIYNTDGRSYTDTYQVDFSWSPVERLDIFATFRYTDSEMTLNRNPQGTEHVRVERPLISQYKTLLNIQYATKFRRWVFDVTAQLNGPSRVPRFVENNGVVEADYGYYSPRYPIFFAQVTRKVGKFDIYVGCENIGDYMQHDPILSADNPFSAAFNSMNVWGPLMGRKFYLGVRFNLY